MMSDNQAAMQRLLSTYQGICWPHGPWLRNDGGTNCPKCEQEMANAMRPPQRVGRTLSPPQQEANALEHRDFGDEDQPSIHHSIHSDDLIGPYPGLATYPPLGSEAQRILTLEAQVAQLRAAIEVLQAAQSPRSAEPDRFPPNALRFSV